MKGYGPSLVPWKRRRRVSSEDVEEGLERVMEHDLIILPGMNGAHLHSLFKRRDLGFIRTDGRPRMQLEVMIDNDGLFTRFGDEVDSNLNLEFSPPFECDSI